MTGLNLMDKTLLVQGAQISFSIWDVGGMYIFVLCIYLMLNNFWGFSGSCLVAD